MKRKNGGMMRKMVGTLILLTVFMLCAHSAFAEAPDEAAALAFNHQVYEANQLDALFGRHEAVSYTFSYPLNPDMNGFVWETKDCIYQEWGRNASQFERDRVVYTMVYDDATGEANVYGGVNYELDYDPLYCFAGGTEEEFFDVAHDHQTSIEEVDGMIRGASQFDDVLSKQYIEEYLGLEYTGQTIKTEMVLDAETYEVLKSADIMVQNGEETVVFELTVQYDTLEPIASRTLRASFERKIENMMTVTFVIDHGTDHEIIKELTVPANMEAGMMYGSTPYVYFNDANCETVSHWDRKSDLNIYLFTNPDDELNERFQTLLEEALREAGTAQLDADAFEMLVAANTGSEILSRHENFQMNRTEYFEEKEIFMMYSYRDAETYLWRNSDGPAPDTFSRANLWLNRYMEEQEIAYVEVLFDTDDAAAYSFAYARDAAVITIPEQEELLETVREDNGLFIAVTQNSDPDFVSQAMEEHATMGGYAYEDGMILQYKYTFDAETKDLLGVDVILIDSAGEAHTYSTEMYAYDVEPYDPAKDGEPFAKYLAASADPEQVRTVSVTFDTNTENEHTVEYVIPHYTYFNILSHDTYVEEIFSDHECTQPYEGSDGVEDLVLYVK